ncbi:hypothetical protein [Cytobacillus massiliigabonensis]|uniref:hypothetical protein n=1 Tax=Cytobacillus massiliigabonensis TaxID=1871011 RepID=UPI000C824E77|nr:hypothetical protein [Cytobacillus massiliigabonensis]
MTKKVTLPREVAEAIESLRNRGESDQDIVTYGIERYSFSDAGIIYSYGKTNFHELMSALVNGFEAEKSPEEKVREYYEHVKQEYFEAVDGRERREYLGKYSAVKTTLDLLGIQIEGVNA